jgi:RHS repeat-associated protein
MFMSSENQLQAQRWRIASDPTNYLYDGADALEEADAGGTVLARFSQGQNIDEPLAEQRSATTSYYQVDGLGSITSLSSTSATIADAYVYDALGDSSASTGSVTNPFRYTGRESDSETGLYYYRARYYDPQTGRFISEDPIRFAGGNDFYGYVWNDPVNYADPLGLCPPAPKPPFIAYPPAKPCDTSGSRDHGYPAEDIRTGHRYGVPIYATEDGIIGNEFSGGYNSPYPGPPAPSGSTDYVILRTYSGNYVKYVHVTPALQPGSIVNAGDVIGYNDNTGRQSGPHVHMEINHNGHKIDPSSYLQFSCSASY